MYVILEGNELNFKTTVAQKLSECTGLEVVKGSSFEIGSLEYTDMVKWFKKIATGKSVIVDRYMYSNLLYATLYEGYTLISQQDKERIEDMIRDRCLLVYLYAPLPVLYDRFAERGDDSVKKERLADINRLYAGIINQAIQNRMNVLMINTEKYNSNDITAIILAKLKETPL